MIGDAETAFVDEVAAAYRALGHVVSREREIGGYRADLVTTVFVGGQPITQVVECIGIELTVPLRLLQPLLNAAEAIRATGLATGLTVVSRRGFSRAAEEAGRAARLKLIEFDELQARVRVAQIEVPIAPSPKPTHRHPAASPSRPRPVRVERAPVPWVRVDQLQRNEVFISYSHKDKKWFDRLRVHLTPLERAGALRRWDDTMIKPGEEWRNEIKAAVMRARVAVILISADFLASDFIATDELPPILEAAEASGAVVLPVIVSPSQFHRTPKLARYQAVNDPSRPLIKMTKAQREEVLVALATRISELFV